VNAAATLLAAQAAGLALTAAEALPFAGPLIRSMHRVHTVFEIHEDIQQELEHLAKRLKFLTGNDYKSLSKDEQEHLDSVLKQVEGAVEQGYKRHLALVLKPEDVKDDLIRAGRFLTDGVSDIGLYRSRVTQLQQEEARLPRDLFELSSKDVVVDEYLTESRCKVYLGSLTWANGQIARVAIKLCRPKGASKVEQLREELLEGECKLQYAARHRSILKLLGLVMHHPHPDCQGYVLLVTPYVELGNLEDVMVSKDPSAPCQQSKVFPEAQQLLTQSPHCQTAILRLLLDVAAGLRHIHNVEDDPIVHLDIKPQNILVDYIRQKKKKSEIEPTLKQQKQTLRLVPKITDFDVSRQLPPERDTTTIAMAVGTAGYMSPEALEPELGKKGPWSDVFSFAMVTHFCVTRTHPFEGLSNMQIFSAMSTKKRPGLRQAAGDACPAWSEALCSMAERAWAEEPTLRPTAEDLWRELCNQLEASRSGAEPGSTSSSSAHASMPASLPALGSTAAAAAKPSSLLAAGSTVAAAKPPSTLLAAGFEFSLLLLQKRKVSIIHRVVMCHVRFIMSGSAMACM